MGKITVLVTGLLFIALFFTGVTMFMAGMQQSYDYNMEGNYSALYRALNKSTVMQTVQNQSNSFNQSISGNLFGEGQTFGFFSWVDWVWKQTIQSVKVIGSSGSTANAIVQGSGEALGISWATGIIALIISVSIILLIWGYLIGRDT